MDLCYSRERGVSPVRTSLPHRGLPAAAEQTPTKGPDPCANLRVARYFCRNASVRLMRSDAKPAGGFELALRNEENPSGLWKPCLASSLSHPGTWALHRGSPPMLPLPLAEQRLPRDMFSGGRRTREPPLISALTEETTCPVSLRPAVGPASVFTPQLQNSSRDPNSNSGGKHPRVGRSCWQGGWEQGWACRVLLSHSHVKQLRNGSWGDPHTASGKAAPALLPAGLPKVPPASRTPRQGVTCVCQLMGEAPAPISSTKGISSPGAGLGQESDPAWPGGWLSWCHRAMGAGPVWHRCLAGERTENKTAKT